MAVNKAKQRLLTTGRPPLAKAKTASLSSKATRTLIRSHHTLHKQLANAVSHGDEKKAEAIRAQINAHGGLESYQLASTLGQSSDRGGDSSKLLVEWLKPDFDQARAGKRNLRLLEVGALSTKNAISAVDCVDMRRIDLKSRQEGIEEMDFMKLRVPLEEAEKYDVISLSLVLNYVPSASGRGDMLRRTVDFLRVSRYAVDDEDACHGSFIPCVFLVLPLPCVSNSRYMDYNRLEEIMGSLGYRVVQRKKTTKLYYELYKWSKRKKEDVARSSTGDFKKVELRSGKTRNNFSITLEGHNHRSVSRGTAKIRGQDSFHHSPMSPPGTMPD